MVVVGVDVWSEREPDSFSLTRSTASIFSRTLVLVSVILDFFDDSAACDESIAAEADTGRFMSVLAGAAAVDGT